MTEPDPTRAALRGWWQALIDDEVERSEAVAWAQEQLATESWRDEVTHSGLQLLNDCARKEGDIAVGDDQAWIFRRYWDWMEVVHQFEDDPAAWNRWYAWRFVSALPDSMRARAAASFVERGFLADSDVAALKLAEPSAAE